MSETLEVLVVDEIETGEAVTNDEGRVPCVVFRIRAVGGSVQVFAMSPQLARRVGPMLAASADTVDGC